MEFLTRWFQDHVPESPAPTIIHNDFKLNNMLFDPEDLSTVVAVLDWEMTTVGDPLFDLAVSLSYWVEGENWVYVDASGVKRTLVKTTLGANTQPAGSYWVDSGAAAGKQWQWLSGTTRYENWNGT